MLTSAVRAPCVERPPGGHRPSPRQPRACYAGGSGHHQVCVGCRARRKDCGFPKHFTRCSVFEEASSIPHAWLGLTPRPDLCTDEAIKSVSKFRGPPGLSEPGALAVCAGGPSPRPGARAPPACAVHRACPPCGPGPGAHRGQGEGLRCNGADCCSQAEMGPTQVVPGLRSSQAPGSEETQKRTLLLCP